MPPVVCMADFSMTRGDAACPYSRRRSRNRPLGIASGKHRVVGTGKIFIGYATAGSPHSPSPSSPISEPDKPINLCFPNSPESSICARIPVDCDDRWIIMKRRQGLLNIVARTIALVRRNHILEKKVEALRLETRNFINSVLNNPENKTNNGKRLEESIGRRGGSEIDERVSSTTDDKLSSWPTSPPAAQVEPPRRKVCTDHKDVTSTHNSTSIGSENRSSDTLVR